MPLRPWPQVEPPSESTRAGREAPVRCGAHWPGQPVGARATGRSTQPTGSCVLRLPVVDQLGTSGAPDSRHRSRLMIGCCMWRCQIDRTLCKLEDTERCHSRPPYCEFRSNELKQLLRIALWMPLQDRRT
ncbi:hypothetical protein PVAP13_2NG038519 [Panicum virgatum]|uniref:Uncharacterized protein n=1 Tax=Panicum virgatum TaxID=38727 RepID=A0A8T0VEB2_PANVG|nr:hypothetical protein PVAP13_2NG038519 [Panicum virgatum]